MTKYLCFTKTNLDRLPVLKAAYYVADTKVPGLRLRVGASGRKTYLIYRKVNRAPRRITVGRYCDLTLEQARKEATRINAEITLGKNPYEERKAKRSELTFKQLAEIYYQEHALKFTKRPEDNKRMMELYILPVIGRHQLREIKAEQIRKLHAKIGEDSGHGTANRVLRIVNAAFNFAIKHGYQKNVNPCYGLTMFKEFSRDRFLSKDELKDFFDALAYERPLFQDFFCILLYTGARKSNVLAMRWEDINLELKFWRIPETQAKNQRVNIVYLSEAALEILKRRHTENENSTQASPYVFPSEIIGGHLKEPKKAFVRIKNRMKVQDIRIHDLRRTLGSYMAISGASLPIIGKALNHQDPDSTVIYARLAQAPVLEAINAANNLMKEN